MSIFGNKKEIDDYSNLIPLSSSSAYPSQQQYLESIREKELETKTLIQIQLSNKDKKIIQTSAKESGLNLSAFIRLTCLRESKRILEKSK